MRMLAARTAIKKRIRQVLHIRVDAKKLGIQIVYQEVDMALYPTLSVAENIVQNDMVMGKSGYIVNWKKAYKQGREALDPV